MREKTYSQIGRHVQSVFDDVNFNITAQKTFLSALHSGFADRELLFAACCNELAGTAFSVSLAAAYYDSSILLGGENPKKLVDIAKLEFLSAYASASLTAEHRFQKFGGVRS